MQSLRALAGVGGLLQTHDPEGITGPVGHSPLGVRAERAEHLDRGWLIGTARVVFVFVDTAGLSEVDLEVFELCHGDLIDAGMGKLRPGSVMRSTICLSPRSVEAFLSWPST